MNREFRSYSYFWESGNFLLYHNGKSSDNVLDHSLIYDIAEDAFVKIEDMEDYSLGDRIMERMRAEGVPIVRELPPDAGFLERVNMALIDAGFRLDEWQRAFEELRGMKEGGCTKEAIFKRLAELAEDRTRRESPPARTP